MEGRIVVDGVLASCYASIDHDIGHIGMIPLRWFPNITQLLFGGSELYVEFSSTLGKGLLPFGQLYKI